MNSSPRFWWWRNDSCNWIVLYYQAPKEGRKMQWPKCYDLKQIKTRTLVWIYLCIIILNVQFAPRMINEWRSVSQYWIVEEIRNQSLFIWLNFCLTIVLCAHYEESIIVNKQTKSKACESSFEHDFCSSYKQIHFCNYERWKCCVLFCYSVICHMSTT